jgi:hypothetical protein
VAGLVLTIFLFAEIIATLHFSDYTMLSVLLNLYSNLGGGFFFPYFTDEETEAP